MHNAVTIQRLVLYMARPNHKILPAIETTESETYSHTICNVNGIAMDRRHHMSLGSYIDLHV